VAVRDEIGWSLGGRRMASGLCQGRIREARKAGCLPSCRATNSGPTRQGAKGITNPLICSKIRLHRQNPRPIPHAEFGSLRLEFCRSMTRILQPHPTHTRLPGRCFAEETGDCEVCRLLICSVTNGIYIRAIGKSRASAEHPSEPGDGRRSRR